MENEVFKRKAAVAPTGAADDLENVLLATRFPSNLVARLRQDATQGGSDYQRLIDVHHLKRVEHVPGIDFQQISSLQNLKSSPIEGYEIRRLSHPLQLRSKPCPEVRRLSDISELTAAEPNRGYLGYTFSCCCCTTASVPPGSVGILQDEEDYFLLQPGYHSRPSCGTHYHKAEDFTKVNAAVRYGPNGFVTIGEGHIGIFSVGLTDTLVPQGSYQWENPIVKFVNSIQMQVNTPIVSGAAGFVMIGEGHIGIFQVDTTYQFVLHGIYEWHNPHIKFVRSVPFTVDKAVTNGASGFVVISEGHIGILQVDTQVVFLGEGTYQWSSPNIQFIGIHSIEVDKVIAHGAAGFVTISEGKLGVIQVGSDYRLLVQGTYQWASPAVRFRSIVTVDGSESCVSLGPYSVVTVPDGEVAVTYNNGVLRVLVANNNRTGESESDACSTYFLDDPKWIFREMVTLKMQTDKLEGNNLLSKDNVELLMVAMSQWRIFDPVLAVTHCASDMSHIRRTVNDLIRATIARIVAGTCIGAGPVGGVAAPVIVGQPVGEEGRPQQQDDLGLAQLMQSDHATKHMAELSTNLTAMGVEVIGVFVPEKRMKNDDIRQEVAKQAVIGIKAEAERAAADAKAYATVKAAFAEAEAIQVVAKAHQEAGRMLGEPESTAARLALTETTSKALESCNMTIFSGMPKDIPYMLSAPPAASHR